MDIRIITDSACDIDRNYAEQNNITILPMGIVFDDEIYEDGIDLSIEEFYSKMAKSDNLPKTNQVNEYAFTKALEPYKNTDTLVLVMTISSHLSNTFNSALSAVKNMEMQNAFTIDTGLVTFAQGALIIETLKLAKSINDRDELISKVNALKNKIKLLAVVDDLHNLRAGGRLSASAEFIGSLLRIHPILTLKEKIEPISKQIGLAKCNKYMVNESLNRDKSYPVYFGHTHCEEKVRDFMNKYSKELDLKGDEFVLNIGPTVGTHAGAGAYGFAYFIED